MKKLILVIMMLVLMSTLCACNQSWGIGNLSFKKIHIDTHHYSGCFGIKSWHDNETGIEVKTGVGSLFFSEGTYFLVEDKCPLCDLHTEKK